MKAKVYLRIARNPRSSRAPLRVAATLKPSDEPLWDSGNKALPTVAFAVEFDLPDALFRRAAVTIAEVKVPPSRATIAARVTPLDAE